MILLFKSFHQHKIQIFTSEYGNEIDGLGILTVALCILHDMDVCKTDAKKKKKGRSRMEGMGMRMRKEGTIKRRRWVGRVERNRGLGMFNWRLTPIRRVQEQRRKRLLFANNPWYIQWAERDKDL